MSAKTNMPWIPVSERLPEQYTKVLVCSDKGDIEICDGSMSTEIPGEWMWYTTNWHFGEVTAWMPLPKPYKEGNDVA